MNFKEYLQLNESEIDRVAVEKAAMKKAKQAFGEKTDKKQVNGMVDKAIKLAKDTKSADTKTAVAIVLGFFNEEYDNLNEYKDSDFDWKNIVTEIQSGIAQNRKQLFKNRNKEHGWNNLNNEMKERVNGGLLVIHYELDNDDHHDYALNYGRQISAATVKEIKKIGEFKDSAVDVTVQQNIPGIRIWIEDK